MDMGTQSAGLEFPNNVAPSGLICRSLVKRALFQSRPFDHNSTLNEHDPLGAKRKATNHHNLLQALVFRRFNPSVLLRWESPGEASARAGSSSIQLDSSVFHTLHLI
jgi:hypothetical protein